MEVSFGVVIGVALATTVAWVVNHLAPGVFASLIKRPPVHVHVEVDPAAMYAGAPNWVGSGWVLPQEVDLAVSGRATYRTLSRLAAVDVAEGCLRR